MSTNHWDQLQAPPLSATQHLLDDLNNADSYKSLLNNSVNYCNSSISSNYNNDHYKNIMEQNEGHILLKELINNNINTLLNNNINNNLNNNQNINNKKINNNNIENIINNAIISNEFLNSMKTNDDVIDRQNDQNRKWLSVDSFSGMRNHRLHSSFQLPFFHPSSTHNLISALQNSLNISRNNNKKVNINEFNNINNNHNYNENNGNNNIFDIKGTNAYDLSHKLNSSHPSLYMVDEYPPLTSHFDTCEFVCDILSYIERCT